MDDLTSEVSQEIRLTMDLQVVDAVDGHEAKMFRQMLHDYNVEQMGDQKFEDLCIILRDDSGNVQGGIDGGTLLGWLWIGHIAVHETLRGQGYGSQLLRAAEVEARRRGCTSAHLQTYSWQARPFYEKHGYIVYGTLNDFPEGYQRFCMMERFTC